MSDDSVTVVSQEGWFSRLKSAIGGVVFGLLLILIGIGLLFWNEGRAVRTAKSLSEGAAAVITVAATPVNPANEGKLVHVFGRCETAETLSDPDLGLALVALKLRRDVQMYQWKETSRTEEHKKLGGGTEKVTTYDYAKDWSSSLINSGDFQKKDGHDNPSSMRYESKMWNASSAWLGGFTFGGDLLDKVEAYEPLAIADTDFARLPSGLASQLRRAEGGYDISADSASPRVGDLRIRFKAIRPLDLTVIARQTGKSFAPYTTQAGNDILMVEVGNRTSEQMFTAAQSRNTMMTWGLRVAGFFCIFIGFSLIFAPLKVVADVIPFIGSIVGLGTGLAAFALAVPISLVVVAMAWIVYRPLLGIALLVAAIAVIGWAVKKGLALRAKA